MRCSTDGMGDGRWKMAKGKWILIFAICHLPFAMPLALACPFCKDALTPGMAKGFYWSILWMLSVPAVVAGVIAGVLWRAGQRRRENPARPHE
jgi:ABC-type uncharacterized transport system permease subunit